MSDRHFSTSEGQRWIRLTGAFDGSAVWLAAATIDLVSRMDHRPLFVELHADDACPGGKRPLPQRVGDRPEWVTLVRLRDTEWNVLETIDEVMALIRGDDLPEPTVIPVAR